MAFYDLSAGKELATIFNLTVAVLCDFQPEIRIEARKRGGTYQNRGVNVTKKFSIEPAYFDLKGLHVYSGGAISVRKLRALLKQADGLPHFRVGRKILVAKTDFDAWVQRFRREPINLDALVDEILSDFFPDRKKKK